jgi:hypothetical protein
MQDRVMRHSVMRHSVIWHSGWRYGSERHSAKRHSTRFLAALVTVALAVVLTGCSGKKAPAPPPATSATATTTAAAPSHPSVNVRASARGEGSSGELARAAVAAAPEIRTFLTRYLNTALDPAGAKDGYKDLVAFFAPDLRRPLARDLGSLSLGRGGGKVQTVTTKPAGAVAVFLIGSGHPLAATVQLNVDGSAATESGSTTIFMRTTMQLQRGSGGWRIASYDSRARMPS